MNKSFWIYPFLVVILIGGLVWLAKRPALVNGPGPLDAFAACIKDSGATFYGAFWCPHCAAQKKEFGLSASLLPYVECSNPNGQTQDQVCDDAKIESYPTWQFKDGSRLTGEQTLATLGQKTGSARCPRAMRTLLLNIASMILFIKNILPTLVLAFDIMLVFVILALIFRRSWGNAISEFVGKHALGLSFATALVAVAGSLFYSNVIGFLPCDLCWWQRIFIYPQLVIFAVAFRRGYEGVFRYTLPLSVIAIIISAYHMYVQLAGYSILPCSATASCTRVYVLAYTYVTIPTMALSIGLALATLAITRKFYDSRKS